MNLTVFVLLPALIALRAARAGERPCASLKSNMAFAEEYRDLKMCRLSPEVAEGLIASLGDHAACKAVLQGFWDACRARPRGKAPATSGEGRWLNSRDKRYSIQFPHGWPYPGKSRNVSPPGMLHLFYMTPDDDLFAVDIAVSTNKLGAAEYFDAISSARSGADTERSGIKTEALKDGSTFRYVSSIEGANHCVQGRLKKKHAEYYVIVASPRRYPTAVEWGSITAALVSLRVGPSSIGGRHFPVPSSSTTAGSDDHVKADEFWNEGMARYERGDIAGAKQVWQQCLSVDPDNSDCADILRRFPGADSASQEVCRYLPPLPATSPATTGDSGTDRAPLPAATGDSKTDHRLAIASWNDGIMRYQKGDFAGAKRAWQRCLSLDPGNPDCSDGLRRVSGGGY